jgi:peptide/nickel transport system permease protein
MIRRLPGVLVRLVVIVLAGGFLAAALVRYSPGFDIDENSWNPRISAVTLENMHHQREQDNRLPVFYLRYLTGALRGDFGESALFRIPVGELLRERAPVSLPLLAGGTMGGVLLAAALAWAAVWPRRRWLAGAASATSGLLLAVPPAVLALAFFFTSAPLTLAIALVLMPRLFGSLRAIFAEFRDSPVLIAARARGLGAGSIAWRYLVLPAAPKFVALCGVGLVTAFGALIPIEALCDVPGIGQLAWRAALGHDLPLLCALALLITFAAAAVYSIEELAG